MVAGRQEEQRLFLAYRRDRDQRTRDQLIERFLPLARNLARRYRRGSEPLEDLEQVASLALVKAVEGFDPARGTAFSSYQEDLTQAEIGRRLGYSQMHVSRLLRDAIGQLATTAENGSRKPLPLLEPTAGVARSVGSLPASIRYLAARETALQR